MERQARRCFAVGTAQRNSAVMRHSARKTKLPTIAREASRRLSKLQQARNPGREHPSRPSGPDVIISKNRIRNRSIEFVYTYSASVSYDSPAWCDETIKFFCWKSGRLFVGRFSHMKTQSKGENVMLPSAQLNVYGL